MYIHDRGVVDYWTFEYFFDKNIFLGPAKSFSFDKGDQTVLGAIVV